MMENQLRKIQKKAVKNLVFNLATPLLFIIHLSNAFCFEYQSFEQKISNNYSLRNVIEKMTRNELEKQLREFVSSGRPNRLVGSSGHKKSQDYLEYKLRSFNSFGASTTKIDFVGFYNNKPYTGINFLWEKKGLISPNEIIILTANYDTLIKDKSGKLLYTGEMPGADNNASGVAIMLSMIEILNKLNLPKTVKLILLDMGEFDSQGTKNYLSSTDFISDKTSKKIKGAINLFMLGHDSRTEDNQKKLNNMNLYSGSDFDFANTLIKSGKSNYNTVTFTLTDLKDVPFFPMDSKMFREAGVPAVTFSQNREGDFNPRYMTSNDFVETLNMNTYINVFRYVTSAVLAWNYDVVK